MTRVTTLRWVLAVAIVAVIPACHENAAPGCVEALARFHDVARCRLVLDGSAASPADALAWCEALSDPRCADEHAALTTCLTRADAATCDPCAAEQEALLDCLGQEPCAAGCPAEPPHTWLTPAPPAVDLLLVVDTSGWMSDQQFMFGQHLSALRFALEAQDRADLHVGVISTDLGTAPYSTTYCEWSDGGRLLTGSCPYPTGAPYLVDVAPTGCAITRDATGWCTGHDCGQASCDAVESGTTLALDARGCPRCVNHGDQALHDAVFCVTQQGSNGCGFEQPLESMRIALDGLPDNAGFLRDDAVLGIVLLGDEDDCSASDPRLFDPSQTGLDSELGPPTSFRCFEHGITCDVNDREAVGPRLGCVPRDDPAALLHPIARYRDFLRALRPPDQLVVATITGPFDGTVMVGPDEYGQPVVQDCCGVEWGSANPGIRLRALVEQLHAPRDLDWAIGSVCAPSYVTQLSGVGEALRARALKLTGTRCLPVPLAGCSDPGAADDQVCNDGCAPACDVEIIYDRGTLEETRATAPPCLEVCAGGPCAGNTEPALAYAGGHPDDVDPALPVPACWHVRHDPGCTASRGAAAVLSMQAALPPRSFVSGTCALLSAVETRCGDGLDDDGDCLVDGDDPDCG